MSQRDSGVVVFDIETTSQPVDQIDPAIIDGLTKYCRTDEERREITDKLGLHSVVGEIACVGLFDPRRQRAAVIYRRDLGEISALSTLRWFNQEVTPAIMPSDNETGLLEAFWKVMLQYEHLISFNGRTFDCPYLMHRSLIRGVHTSRNLFTNRYQIGGHLDICDYLTGFGASRRYSLDLWSRALGLPSPKAASGEHEAVDGSMVSLMIAQGKIAAVADYCLRDVVTTALLANHVARYYQLAPYEELLSNP